MKRAWVIGVPGGLLAAVDRALAQLGYDPRFLAPDEVGSADRTTSPGLLVLVDEVERVGQHLGADDALARVPTLVVADAERVATGGYASVGHELLVHPFSDAELEVRVARARRLLAVGDDASDVVRCGTLELNAATYQVTVDGTPIDFTYMEYELLKFLVTHPGRVFSRDALLSNVWGYDYYGGARTVDVHIRRLRAKLGNEHAARIRTLRSVGYRWDGERP